VSQERGVLLSRSEVAEEWYDDEFRPVVEMLREADLIRHGMTDTEAYMRVAHLRYLLLRTHEWDDSVIDAVRHDLEDPSLDEDTMVRTLRRELR
jgi:hypothetical protein